MPSDSNGNYSLPGSYFVSNGDTVLPVQHNPPFEDVGQALTNRIMKDGRTVLTGALKMGGFKVTGLADGENPSDAAAINQVVRVDAEQSLSESEMATARDNIGASALQFDNERSPFGAGGIRTLIGDHSSHVGFNSKILVKSDGSWTIVYRSASNHTVVNGAEIRAVDTADQGETLTNDRVIFTNASYDTRNFVAGQMANGRWGILASRRQADLTYLDGIFIYSDDEGDTWSSAALPTHTEGAGSDVNFHGQIFDFPASIGGDDVEGFFAFPFGSGLGNVYAIKTTNNGDTWAWEASAVATPTAPVTALLEPCGFRVGSQDKWVFYCRVSGQEEAVAFTTADPFDWGTQGGSGLDLERNPPQALYDDATAKGWLFGSIRWDRPITVGEYELHNHIVAASADSDALFAAGGDFSGLDNPVGWSILTAVPTWAAGYMFCTEIDDKWFATFVAEEDQLDHSYSSLFLIGDFISAGYEASDFAGRISETVSKRLLGNFPNPGGSGTDDIAISSGSITITQSYHIIDTQGDASSDTLTNIDGGDIGTTVLLQTATGSRDITIVNGAGGAGQINCGSNRVLSDPRDKIWLVKNTVGEWDMISFADNRV